MSFIDSLYLFTASFVVANLILCGANTWMIVRNRRTHAVLVATQAKAEAAVARAVDVRAQMMGFIERIRIADITLDQAAMRLWADSTLPLDEFVARARPIIEEIAFAADKRATAECLAQIEEEISASPIALDKLPVTMPDAESIRRNLDVLARGFAHHCLDSVRRRAIGDDQ